MVTDRLLTLKMDVDTDALDDSMKTVSLGVQEVGKSYAKTVKGFAIQKGADAVEHVAEQTKEGAEEMKALEVAAAQATLQMDEIGASADEQAAALEEMTAASKEFGFDETEIVNAFTTILNQADSVEEAMVGLNTAMDLTRAEEELTDLAAGAELVRDVFAGDLNAAVDDFGASMDENASAIDNVTEGFARYEGAAEAYADTTTGTVASATQTMDQLWSDLAATIGEFAQTVIPILIDALNVVMEVFAALQPVIQAVMDVVRALSDVIVALEPLWRPIVDFLTGAFGEAFTNLVAILENVAAAITKVADLIAGLADVMNNAIGAISEAANGIADAILGPFSAVFDLLGGIGDRIGNILGRSSEVESAYDAALYEDKAGRSLRGNVIMNVVGDPALIAQSVERSLHVLNGRRVRNRLGRQYG